MMIQLFDCLPVQMFVLTPKSIEHIHLHNLNERSSEVKSWSALQALVPDTKHNSLSMRW